MPQAPQESRSTSAAVSTAASASAPTSAAKSAPEAAPPAAPAAAPTRNPAARAAWLKTLHQWHWISSALCLIGMLLFAATGITLNHAASIESKPAVVTRDAQVPDELMVLVRPPEVDSSDSTEGKTTSDKPSGTSNNGSTSTSTSTSTSSKHQDNHHDEQGALPAPLRDWLTKTLGRTVDDRDAEWSRDEIYLSMPRPGGDAWVRIDRATGGVEFEDTDRGWISYFNDLHKGRHAGVAWSWFIDIFAVACLLFSLTGLLILKFHAVSRPSTWPMVGLGFLVPALLALLLMH